MRSPYSIFPVILFLLVGKLSPAADEPAEINPPRPRLTRGQLQISGIYPHLAVFNDENECGIGAVVPWAGRLWVVTYAPHAPTGSTDKLYEITPDLAMTIRPESIGGTPANRMIHRESQQLFIGPYVIDENRNVRVIPYQEMFGRPTGNARHLTDPAGKIYYATMEEGLYEVDVKTLEVTELWRDEQLSGGRHADLPGYHGKGLYSGQGRLIYANNGEHGAEAMQHPAIPSGALATWEGRADDWTLVRRNQFTEVTGPGGIRGNQHPETDPVWSIGWDHRSLILAMLDDGGWSIYRLPKSSHSYDGAHGWNTEWPRIRDIGEDELLMTMHGQFWRFPRTFREGHTAGIEPRSSYLKVIADFCRWNNRIVFGCDDAARSEFLNTRKAKGNIAGPACSQSNLWFVEPERLDHFGPSRGRGAVWLRDQVHAGDPSDPFLFSGFDDRGVHLAHDQKKPVTLRFEVDKHGNGQWTFLESVTVPASGYRWHSFDDQARGAWIRVVTDTDCRATAWFEYRDENEHPVTVNHGSSGSPEITRGLARADFETSLGGLVRAGGPARGLQFLATRCEGAEVQATGYYELKPNLKLVRVNSPKKQRFMTEKVAIPDDVLAIKGHSVLYVSDNGDRFRLPIGNPIFLNHPALLNTQRISREATTERDLFQAAGTFYELPARNAGGFPKIMPIATHPFLIQDYCSWRGLLVMTGIDEQAPDLRTKHVVRSEDGHARLWLGAIDDLWQFGKPVGTGGPWFDSRVEANMPSDPYLMAGYDDKTLTLSHTSENPVVFEVQIDITGTGFWKTYATLTVPAGETVTHEFPPGFEAYWVRFVAKHPTTATAMLRYE